MNIVKLCPAWSLALTLLPTEEEEDNGNLWTLSRNIDDLNRAWSEGRGLDRHSSRTPPVFTEYRFGFLELATEKQPHALVGQLCLRQIVYSSRFGRHLTRLISMDAART